MSLKTFLRYNTRHTIWFPRGYKDRYAPMLNPISSCSHGADGVRTIYLNEPRWMFKLRQRLFSFAGRQYCGRRGESWHGATDHDLPDTWDLGPDGNRTCSYCGSIHPDDLMEICRKTLESEEYGVEGTDKSYKVYVRQPGVRNASEGAIKFYKQHAPERPTEAEKALFSAAVRVTHERFMKRYYPEKAAS
jgi:hypothetical protein